MSSRQVHTAAAIQRYSSPRGAFAFLLALAMLALISLLPSLLWAGSQTAACPVSYTIINQWPGGFQAQVNINNSGPPINGWTVSWNFGQGQVVTQLWNGAVTQSGSTVTVTNLSYNSSIQTGGSTGLVSWLAGTGQICLRLR